MVSFLQFLKLKMRKNMKVDDLTQNEINERIEYSLKNIPEDILSVFTDQFLYFLDSCLKESEVFLKDDEDFEDYEKYLEIFLKFPFSSEENGFSP